MNISSVKHAYVVGAGGISMSAIVKLFLDRGTSVSGFDVIQSAITDELNSLGADITTADSGASLPEGVDLLVYSEAVPEGDSLRAQGREQGIKQMAAAVFWGEYAKGKKVIAVSGTNGKSTTTAMLGLMLEKAGFDPTVVVGTRVLQWDSNIRIGKSDWLVIEADEYAAKMLNYKPDIAVITNIAADHLDFYKNEQDIASHFQKWINAMPLSATVILNRDDERSALLDAYGRNKRVFGLKGDAGVRAAGIMQTSGASEWVGSVTFNIVDSEKDWGIVIMRVPGEHTIANAVAAATAADSAGVPRSIIRAALSEFSGTWRRFEMVGEYNGALIVSDYGHHPAGIRATLKAARAWYPFRRIVVLFQPHHRNRTKNLFHEFAAAFFRADVVIISEIYDVSGREDSGDKDISSKDLAAAIKKAGHKAVSYAKNLDTAESMLKKIIQPEDVVIIMGAGDVDQVARNIAQPYESN
ncbi:MAG: UDP-N-acetylmuramate--L-alanine ligase [bacterium]|nr:UDP-N-acetylmuramate--L-alanine ligase [bacterium]